MTVAVENYVIEQGDDTDISFVYKTKEDVDSIAVPVDLTGYSVRMDIVTQGTGTRVWTFNSSDNAGASPIDLPGAGDNEAVLGSDGSINISIPRVLTLAGGAIFTEIAAGRLVFDYDLFLRGPDNRQKKILKGSITVNKSNTLWV